MDRDNSPFSMPAFYLGVLLNVGTFNLAYDKFGQNVQLPAKNSDSVKMRRYERLAKATTPLTIGVSPVGSRVVSTDIIVQVKQYGDWVPFTDDINQFGPDKNLIVLTGVLRKQWAETINQIARDNVTATSNRQYVDLTDPRTNTARGDIKSEDKISMNEVQLAVKTLEKAGAETITDYVNPMDAYGSASIDPAYVGIADPDTAKDLKNVPGFLKTHQYARGTALLPGEFGSLDDVRFVKDTEGMTYVGAGFGGIDVHCTVIFGMNAYGVVEVGENSTEMIIHELGHGDDQLNMRGSIGWKQWYAAKVLNDAFIIALEHAVSA